MATCSELRCDELATCSVMWAREALANQIQEDLTWRYSGFRYFCPLSLSWMVESCFIMDGRKLFYQGWSKVVHYSYKSRVIPVLWLSFVCQRGVGEVGHLVRDLEVLLCPFPLGNKSCPVKWTKLKLNHDFFYTYQS